MNKLGHNPVQLYRKMSEEETLLSAIKKNKNVLEASKTIESLAFFFLQVKFCFIKYKQQTKL